MRKITSLTPDEVKEFFLRIGQPVYRVNQLMEWVYKKGATSFNCMSNLPMNLRTTLSDEFSISQPFIEDSIISNDGLSIKAIVKLSDGEIVESVFIKERRWNTLCLSVQVGCPLGCIFCATGAMGFRRNLTIGEIVGQVRLIRENIGEFRNIVFMGISEPLLNYENLLYSINLVSKLFTIGKRRMVVSTAGFPDKMRRLADDRIKVKMALSLNATDDEKRRSLMPGATSSIDECLRALGYYSEKIGIIGTIAYVLINDVNDSNDEAFKLLALTQRYGFKINLIPYNGAEGQGFKRPIESKINEFFRILKQGLNPVTIRNSFGCNISAACGQLAVRHKPT
ncbi:MAG: 23S rRNA (adenine(2503)-C(2))-methyltransferase RlmN [bacterium]